ncbi:MAG TPA: cbb3-type cytochrome c oxidase subunit II [Bryobacteraceae bacterium]|nr:cbb3-type cytochrome c oxidase subunit II [Bryobacteraceae bacterium]
MRRFLRMSYLVAAVGGVGFFLMSVLLLGVWPGRVLEAEIHAMSPANPLALSASEERGRTVYAREGCAYCHTQQVRYLSSDVSRFGAATLAWETVFDYPHLWGTRRIGPDLSREHAARSSDWQLEHLYAPRNVVQDSVMPAFPWLFNGSPDRPRQEASDLLAYLETLGRDRALAAPEGEARARSACNCSDDEKRFAFGAPISGANPATPRRGAQHPPLAGTGDLARGRALYRRDCSGCHGTQGQGDGAAAAALHPRPVNFSEHQYTPEALSVALWNGVAGTAMPAWRDLPPQDLSAIAQLVSGFYAAPQEPAIPKDVLDLGERVYSAHCAQCHGDRGAGDGSAAGQFPVPPTNFQIERPTLAASLRALRKGVEGTPMAAWSSQLSEAELSAAAYFVRGFFRPGAGTVRQ